MSSRFLFTENFNEASNMSLSGWEEDDPCKYSHQSCKGKLFGALKRCRDRREKSRALCRAAKREEEKNAEIQKELREVQKAASGQILKTSQAQQTATMALIAVGGSLLAGSILVFAARKSRKSKINKEG